MTAMTSTERSELIRAVGAAIYTPPPQADTVCAALDLPVISSADHTEAFVLLMPPHAAIHLGPEGQLGGEGLDRIEGFWRALGLSRLRDADHLGVLLMSYADLATIHPDGGDRRAAALFGEHIWSWAPGYLTELCDLGIASITAWAELALEICHDERQHLPEPAELPLALRGAPPAITPELEFDDLLDALISPIRSGLILNHRTLAAAATRAGLGYRRGERRYALKAMLNQDPEATLHQLAQDAERQANRRSSTDPSEVGSWWARRASATSTALHQLAARVPAGAHP